MTSEAVDATLVEEEIGTELAVVVDGGQVIRADEPTDVIEKATKIANALSGLIEKQGLAVNVGGKRKHVEVGGWQALGAMLGALGGQPLHAETVWARPLAGPDGVTIIRDSGFDWEACVEIRTPSGVVVGKAEAMCSRSEKKWARSDDYAVRSMAETRAESRAYRRAAGWIVNIAGYNPTPAEEMPTAAEIPDWALPASGELELALRRALAYLLGVEITDDLVNEVGARMIGDTDGKLTKVAARAIAHVAAVLKASADAASTATTVGTDGQEITI